VVLPGHVDFARLPQQVFVLVSALAVSLLWVIQGAPGGNRATRLDAPLLAFLVWSAASLLGSAEPAAGLRTLGHWAACALVFLVVSRSTRAADAPRLASGLLLGGALAAAVGLGQALFGLSVVPQAGAPAATMANRGVAAGYLATLAPLALLAGPSRAARVAAVIGTVTMLGFLPFTWSRAAAVAIGLQLLLLVALRQRSGRRRWLAPLGVGLLTLGAVAWISWEDPVKARSAGIRWTLAESALSMARERPLVGVGIGGFGARYPLHGPVVTSARGAPLRVDSPHNEGLQVMAESGLLGFLAGTWVAAGALGAFRRLRASADAPTRRTALALGLSLVGFAVDAAFGFPLRNGVPPLVLAVLLGMLAAFDPRRPAAPCRLASPGPCLRAAAALGLALALAGATSWSLRRLRDDRARYEGAFVPVAHAQDGLSPLEMPGLSPLDLPGVSPVERPSVSPPELPGLSPADLPSVSPPGLPGRGSTPGLPCRAGVFLDVRPDGRIDLAARNALLPNVLDCLVERLALRLEYDGRPPPTAVSVALRGQTLAGAIVSILEGLGVNYLLGLDESQTNVDRLIVFGSSAGGDRGRPEGGTEPSPEPGVPEEVTPMTLQLGHGPAAGVASIGISPMAVARSGERFVGPSAPSPDRRSTSVARAGGG
jgi:hypothetical protein